jgi:hypothetical protein
LGPSEPLRPIPLRSAHGLGYIGSPANMVPSRNHGVRKVCACGKARWPKCAHSWYFNFTLAGGQAYRFSLDKHLGRRVVTKSEATAEAVSIRAAIREGRFQTGAPETSEPPDALTVSKLVAAYQQQHLEAYKRRSASAEAARLRIAMRTEIAREGRRVACGSLRAADVTARDIDALVAARASARRKHCRCESWDACSHPWRESAAGGSVAANRIHARLRACFNWALRKQLVTRTPFRIETLATVPTRKENSRYRRLEGDEEQRLLGVRRVASAGSDHRGLGHLLPNLRTAVAPVVAGQFGASGDPHSCQADKGGA